MELGLSPEFTCQIERKEKESADEKEGAQVLELKEERKPKSQSE